MKQDQVGNESAFFYDTYALFQIALGADSYQAFTAHVTIYTTIMNLYEFYYILLRDKHFAVADKFFERFLPFCIAIEPVAVKEAARFRILHSKSNLSYVDCLGYVISKQLGVAFLTGDGGFEKLPNVKFVK